MGVLFSELADHYSSIESLSKRLEMTDRLIDLFANRSAEDLEMIIRLTKGEVRPGYEGLDLGVAEKLAMKALYMVTMVPLEEIVEISKREGDIGSLAEEIMKRKKQMSLFSEPLTLERVFLNLEKIARAKGKASQDLKLKLIAEMLHDSQPLEARYITRIVCGKMRLGIADMTVIDSLSYLYTPGSEETAGELDGLELPENLKDLIGSLSSRRTAPLYELMDILSRPKKHQIPAGTASEALLHLEAYKKNIIENRERLVRVFNVHPDLGSIGRKLEESGMEDVTSIGVEPGIPLRSMLGERLSSVTDILEKMGGESAFEYKYDGLRVQAHIRENGEVRMFSRQLEDITDQFPDVSSSLKERFLGTDTIVEGECVPIDAETGSFLPFQVISRRRGRKYDLEEKMEEIPVLLVMFDCLYHNGVDMTERPYLARRETLKELFSDLDSVNLALSTMEIIKDRDTGQEFFERALEEGCEGVMAKNISGSSIYQAGSRGWLWIKYKQDYRTELSDTLDLVVVGAFHGTGRRKGTYGALLMAVNDREEGVFRTVCKLGSGFNDGHLKDLVTLVDDIKGEKETVWMNVMSGMEPDIYTPPLLVLEVLAAEITFSPVHTCSYGKLKEDAGLALRFPRFTGRFRKDKGPEDATTDEEVRSMYSLQTKTITSDASEEE